MHGLSLPVRLASCEYNITIRMLATWHNYSHPLYRFSRIIPNASSCLLFSKLCLHNRRIPSALQLSLTHSVHVLCKLISEDWPSHPHMNMIYIVVCKYDLFVVIIAMYMLVVLSIIILTGTAVTQLATPHTTTESGIGQCTYFNS